MCIQVHILIFPLDNKGALAADRRRTLALALPLSPDLSYIPLRRQPPIRLASITIVPLTGQVRVLLDSQSYLIINIDTVYNSARIREAKEAGGARAPDRNAKGVGTATSSHRKSTTK